RPALAHEIAADGVNKVGALAAVHVAEEFIDHRHRDLRPTFTQLRAPALHVVLIGELGHLVTIAARLHRHGRDDAVAGPLQQVPNERAADAEAEHHELPDAEG